MSTDDSHIKRNHVSRKTLPKSRNVSLKTSGQSEKHVSSERIKRRIRFRSKFEVSVAKSLADRGIKFEYESEKIVFVPKPRTYTPDFYLPHNDIYIEAKGHLDKGDRVKMVLVKEQNPHLDIRFVFLNARNKIYKGSKTTYGDWATRHGFEWAEKSIPEEWLK
jgi:predicted nuclease of restriction endonuclease-like RecB superfamily